MHFQTYYIFWNMHIVVPQAKTPNVCDGKTKGDVESLLLSHTAITLRAELILNAFVIPHSLSFKPFGTEWNGYLMIKKYDFGKIEKKRERCRISGWDREREKGRVWTKPNVPQASLLWTPHFQYVTLVMANVWGDYNNYPHKWQR